MGLWRGGKRDVVLSKAGRNSDERDILPPAKTESVIKALSK